FYRDNNGVERMGVPLSDSAYRNHQRLSRLNEFLLSSTKNPSVPTPPTQVTHQHSIQAPGETTNSSYAGPSMLSNRHIETNNSENNTFQ
ncbi:hypothetical protein VP01_13301g1, partial [Puccinia sorghi]